jgi:hypothetical protein
MKQTDRERAVKNLRSWQYALANDRNTLRHCQRTSNPWTDEYKAAVRHAETRVLQALDELWGAQERERVLAGMPGFALYYHEALHAHYAEPLHKRDVSQWDPK